MFDCGQKEETFWRTMNPRRLHALFNARFSRHGNQAAHSPAPERTTERSLLQYLIGGG